MKKILSIDGGGIRGIVPGQVMVTLEEKLQRISGRGDVRLADYFDFMAGTSTGGILTCIYLCPDGSGKRSRFSAKEAVELYSKNGGDIFKLTFWEKVKTLGGLLDEKYKANKLEGYLKQYFGDLKLSQLLKPCLISSFDITQGIPFFFTQHDAILKGNEFDFLVKDVCRSTSAAPTYFEVSLATSLAGKQYPLIDGGVFANNPSMCAYAEVRCSKSAGEAAPKAADMFIVSLSTGSSGVNIKYDKAKSWGAAQWVRPIIDVMMSGVAQTTDYELQRMFDAVSKPENYIRVAPAFLDPKHACMDDASTENIDYLIKLGEDTAKANDQQLENIARIIIEDAADPVEYGRVS